MKSILFVLTLVVGASAFARSPRDIRLMLDVDVHPRALVKGKFDRSIIVYGDGEVQGVSCPHPAKVNSKCSRTTLDNIGAGAMARIRKQIRQAAAGPIVPPNPAQMTCKAMPTSIHKYSADNGKVLLWTAAVPCGRATVNQNPAAKPLMELLRKYLQKYQGN